MNENQGFLSLSLSLFQHLLTVLHTKKWRIFNTIISFLLLSWIGVMQFENFNISGVISLESYFEGQADFIIIMECSNMASKFKE